MGNRELREQLIQDLNAFVQRRIDAKGTPKTSPSDIMLVSDVADFILERESVYRDICEAAIALHFINGSMHKQHEGYNVRRDPDHGYKNFPTLTDAWAWVKQEGKDGR